MSTTPVVTPLHGIQSGAHMLRCSEMAHWIAGRPVADPAPTIEVLMAWHAYLAGTTDDRPDALLPIGTQVRVVGGWNFAGATGTVTGLDHCGRYMFVTVPDSPHPTREWVMTLAEVVPL